MKRKFAIFNLTLMAVVLFTTAFQSFHAFNHHSVASHSHHHDEEHEAKQFGASDVNHEHEDDCSVCDFDFDYFVAPQQFCLRFNFPFTPIPYRYSSTHNVQAFSGSLFALRAPPAIV
ncbi:hypothetical protein [Flavobacterium litorale]|uniref:DUF2946 domain-containing protein n=1 Tax=Flavobacterium litorale TaxID=2856519 RepID=A0ABX8V7D9_9FLAO|nr:hypothetical protein [Flavobacterium litorale]QYJ68759.1 hypothetical protein K1I41_02440 [Flavobacterium litorale]